jgi:basic amino acid/polyamine antiporter, APA family
MSIFRTKVIGAETPSGLKRALGPGALIALGIGAIIGTGIFVLTGLAAAQHAGPALVVSFIMAGFACALAGLCYAEFAAMIPVSGSAYSYSYATLGEGVAWFVGWLLVLEYLFAAATVSVGWSGYVVSFLNQIGVHLPAAISSAPFGRGPGGSQIVATGAILNFPAVFVIAVITALCYTGIKQSANFNTIVVTIKVIVIVLFIAFGISFINTANWHPFIPPNEGPGRYGWDGVGQAAAIIFFAYIGFDAVSTAAQEAKNPQRDMPIGILGSLVICTILYIAVSAVLTGMVHYTELNVPAPIAYALDKYAALGWLGFLIKLGAIAGMTSVILVMILGQSRIFFTMSKDGLIPAAFGRVHPKFQTPGFATLATGTAAAVIGGLLPVNILGELVSFGTLTAFLVVCLGVLVLRSTRPDLPRPFRVPAAALVCILGALSCGYLIYKLPSDTWLRAAIWTAIGLVIYFFYGYRNSILAKPAP